MYILHISIVLEQYNLRFYQAKQQYLNCLFLKLKLFNLPKLTRKGID